MKNKCPICGAQYIHQKRLISHMVKGNCGVLAGQMGIKLDIDKRYLRGRNLEKEQVETENIEEAEPQTTIKVDVEGNQPEPDTDNSDDNGVQSKPKSRTRKIKEKLDCPECGATIEFSRTPEELEGEVTCEGCGNTWEWVE